MRPSRGLAKIAWIYIVGGITGRRPARVDRRAALLLFSPNFGLAGAEAAADIMAEALGWDAPRKIKELAQ